MRNTTIKLLAALAFVALLATAATFRESIVISGDYSIFFRDGSVTKNQITKSSITFSSDLGEISNLKDGGDGSIPSDSSLGAASRYDAVNFGQLYAVRQAITTGTAAFISIAGDDGKLTGKKLYLDHPTGNKYVEGLNNDIYIVNKLGDVIFGLNSSVSPSVPYGKLRNVGNGGPASGVDSIPNNYNGLDTYDGVSFGQLKTVYDSIGGAQVPLIIATLIVDISQWDRPSSAAAGYNYPSAISELDSSTTKWDSRYINNIVKGQIWDLVGYYGVNITLKEGKDRAKLIVVFSPLAYSSGTFSDSGFNKAFRASTDGINATMDDIRIHPYMNSTSETTRKENCGFTFVVKKQDSAVNTKAVRLMCTIFYSSL